MSPRQAPAEPPPTSEGLSAEQRVAMDAYVTELGQLGGPPPPPPAAEPPRPTDDQWANMTDRARENWVANQVGWYLDELAKLDADQRRDREIEELKNKKPEEEAPPQDKLPTPLERFRKILWGEQK